MTAKVADRKWSAWRSHSIYLWVHNSGYVSKLASFFLIY